MDTGTALLCVVLAVGYFAVVEWRVTSRRRREWAAYAEQSAREAERSDAAWRRREEQDAALARRLEALYPSRPPAPVVEAPPEPAPPSPTKRPSVALPFAFAQVANGESEDWARHDVTEALEDAWRDAGGDWGRVVLDDQAVKVAEPHRETR